MNLFRWIVKNLKKSETFGQVCKLAKHSIPLKAPLTVYSDILCFMHFCQKLWLSLFSGSCLKDVTLTRYYCNIDTADLIRSQYVIANIKTAALLGTT